MMPPEVQHARALERRARQLQSAGRYAEALAPLQEAISFWQARDGAHSLDALAGLMNLAVARRRMGDAAQAAAMLEAVAPQLANNEAPEASGLYHSALNNLATAYRELGRDADARRAWERLAGRLASVGDRESWARVSSNLSTLLADLGDLEAAERTARQAVDAWRVVRGDGDVDTALATVNLGSVLGARGQ